METKTALVLGATGGIGGAVARRLTRRGWTVRGLHRKPADGGKPDGIGWIKGDAMSALDVARAAEGVSLIVHAVNPPAYRNWGELVLPMIDNTIAAAKANGARVVLPGTVYNHGPDSFPVVDELSPQSPLTRKGRIRVELEARLERGVATGRMSALIVRAGDFFGPAAGNNWFSQGLVRPGRALKSITYPGREGIGHQWAYLPDVAETMMRLVARDDLEPFARFGMEGQWDADGTRMVEAIRTAAGRPDLPVRRMPWTLMRLASPFVPVLRELSEMRYLWQQPVRLDNSRLLLKLGQEPRTPLVEAVRATLAGLGCLLPQEAPPVDATPRLEA